MAIDDFKKMYGQFKVASDAYDQNQRTVNSIVTSKNLEALAASVGEPNAHFVEESARTDQAKGVAMLYDIIRVQMADSVKSNLTDVLNSSKEILIRAAALGFEHEPKLNTDLAFYLEAYKAVEDLIQAEIGENRTDEESKKRKRLTPEEKSAKIAMFLPLVIEERLKGKVDDEYTKQYAKAFALLGQHNRGYVIEAIVEGQSLIAKSIERIGIQQVRDYVRTNLKKDEDYILFGEKFGEACLKYAPKPKTP